MDTPILWWVGFNAFVLLMLALDLGVFHRKSHEVKFKEALGWSIAWITLAMLFNLGLWHVRGSEAALQFLTGYVVEKSLSVDNIFVFLMVFSYFHVPPLYQHKVLFWGILGALVMRAIFIFAGVALISQFHWMIYVFGAFLLITGIKMALMKDKKIEPEKNPVVRLFRRLVPVTDRYHGDKFFVKLDGRTFATPLMVTLIFIELTDVIFAVDSIPAILAITQDPFLVYTSNVCAILGLRSLYFLLAGFIHKFHYLKLGLAVVLTFVGVKMLLGSVYHIPIQISLLVIAGVLASAVVGSILFPKKEQ